MACACWEGVNRMAKKMTVKAGGRELEVYVDEERADRWDEVKKPAPRRKPKEGDE